MNITFNENMRPDSRAKIEGYLKRFAVLVPSWVHTIHCNLWDAGSDGERISIKVNYDYRDVCLDFVTAWLDESDENQAKQVLHEILHIHLSLIADFARDKINLLCPSHEAEKFNASLQEELRCRHESATCDLTEVLWNLPAKL